MPIIKFIKPYKFAHHGCRVEEFEPGDEPVETTDECAAQAIEDGVAKPVKAKAASAEQKADKPADEKAEDKAPE